MNSEFMSAIKELGREKGIGEETLYDAIEAAILSAYKKNFGTGQNVRILLDKTKGDIKILARREIVEEVTDKNNHLSIESAQKIDPRYELGDIVETEIKIKDFGRLAAQNAKQVVVQRIREAERGKIFEEYYSRENDIVNGIVQRTDSKAAYIELGKADAILSISEQIPGETLQNGDRIKAYIIEVKKSTKNTQILLSRTHPGLLKRLFELEVPEIKDGIVEIKAVSRESGIRSKISVFTRDENVDPVGACVGHKGLRVQNIVNELRGEKIDIVEYDTNPAVYISNALSPAKVVSVDVNEAEKSCRVVVPDFQLSLAIGKEGQNARLAAKLTGWKIDIKSETQALTEDVRA